MKTHLWLAGWFDSDIVENTMIEGSGGGVHAEGGVSIHDSIVRNNLTTLGGWGGGVAVSGGAGNGIFRTTVGINTAAELGGGVVAYGVGTTLDIEESTIDNNLVNWNAPFCTSCLAGGGGVAAHQGSIVRLFNSTVSTNNVNPNVDPSSPQPVGGAIWVTNPGATLEMDYATVAENNVTLHGATLPTDSGIQCDGTCTVNDSIAEDTCTTTGTLTWGLTAVDAAGGSCSGGPTVAPFLLPLSFSGGSPTRTHPHPPGSAADNTANAATCPAIDQRGVTRNLACDVGAHEVP